jgi:hypothetical protein
MAKNIYSLKTILLEENIVCQLPKGKIFASGQVTKLRRFVEFIVYIYVPWWYSACHPENAPANDLKLCKNITEHPDRVVSASAIKAFSKHTWYLTEELVLLSLFSKEVPFTEKADMVAKLVSLNKVDSFTKRHGSSYGKPILWKSPHAWHRL